MGGAARRILAVLVGFALAAIAGAVTLFYVGSRWAAQEVSSHMADNPDEMSRLVNEALGMMAFLFSVAPVLTLAPAVVAVVVGEVARIRSLLYYVLAGGASAALMPLIAARTEAAESATYNVPYFSIMATAGFAAGLVYWLLAGRRA